MVLVRVALAIHRALRAEKFPQVHDPHDAEAAYLVVAVRAPVRGQQLRLVVASYADPVATAHLAAAPVEVHGSGRVSPHLTHATFVGFVPTSLRSIELCFVYRAPDRPDTRELPANGPGAVVGAAMIGPTSICVAPNTFFSQRMSGSWYSVRWTMYWKRGARGRYDRVYHSYTTGDMEILSASAISKTQATSAFSKF
jgi:hypothetical protein